MKGNDEMKINYKGYNGILIKTTYATNGNVALFLADEEDLFGPPIIVVTVNTGEILPEGVAYVKDYSENSGIMSSLKEAGVIDEVIGVKQSGFVSMPLVKFNMEGIKSIEEYNH